MKVGWGGPCKKLKTEGIKCFLKGSCEISRISRKPGEPLIILQQEVSISPLYVAAPLLLLTPHHWVAALSKIPPVD